MTYDDLLLAMAKRINDVELHLGRRVIDLERRDRASKRTGVVDDVKFEGQKGYVRVEFMKEGWKGKPFRSGWLPWVEQSAGKGKTHFTPSKGQQVTVHSENGDMTDGVVHLSINSDENERPSNDPEEFVLIDNAEGRIALKGDLLTIKANVQIIGEFVRHNAKEIGDTHGHISAPPGPPGPPV